MGRFYGGFGVDDVAFDGANLDPPVSVAYGYESDLEGWTAGHCAGVGSDLGVAPLSLYGLTEYCECGMAGNVIEFHDDDLAHPAQQYEMAISPILDREDLGPGYLDYNVILGEMQIAASSAAAGLFYRLGWLYYPYEDPDVPELVGWSPRVGSTITYYVPETGCATLREFAIAEEGIPADARKTRLPIEVAVDCSALG
jgi:hypothetical protein